MLKRIYLNLKIKEKMLIIQILETLLFIAIGLGALQVSFYIYDMQLDENAERALNLYSVNIESALNGVSNLSFNIFKDAGLQRDLEENLDHESSYQQYMLNNDINNILQTWYASAGNLVLSIQVFDMSGAEVGSRDPNFNLTENQKAQIISKARSANGNVVWIPPVNNDDAIILTRTIRKISKLNLTNLGVLVIRVNPKELIDMYSQYLPEYDSNIYILSPTEVILGKKDGLDLGSIMENAKKNSGYFTADLEHKKTLVIYRKSSGTDWIFANIVPYQSIYENVIWIRATLIVFYLLLFALLLFLSLKFSRTITNPIEQLIDKMKTIETGEFENLSEIQVGQPNIQRKDEVGTLQRDFNLMIKEIGYLINENYIKQLQVKEFEYKSLQAQINPHFLYNTLDSINWLAKMNHQQQISVMVKSLGDLMRYSISKKERIITLREELKILNDYITIQKIRYSERLEVSISIGEELYDCLITKLTLQPIVENSINYGLETSPGICRVAIYARILDDRIELNIEDNGPGIREEILEAIKTNSVQSKGSGIGLNNIDDRLKLTFGPQCGLSIDSAVGKGTTVHVYLPPNKSKTQPT